MMRKQIKVVYTTPEEINKVLDSVQGTNMWLGEPDKENINRFKQNTFIVDKMVEFQVFAWNVEEQKAIKYVCYKDDRDVIPSIPGSVAYRTLCKYQPIFDIAAQLEDNELFSQLPSASPLIGFNEKYSGTRQEAWGYDLNSAYSKALTSMWIDTTVYPEQKNIEEGKEVGFEIEEAPNGELIWHIKRKGFCKMVFPIQEVPEGIKKFVEVWYSRKKAAKTVVEKRKAKDMLNLCIGYLQRKNPFLRLMVVCLCNEYIESLIDENTLFYNTDSIVSRVRRPDIESNLGTDIGQWKIEHSGKVAYIGNTYQWNNSIPTWRGTPKSWFPKDYDLLTDGIPEDGNIWEFNEKTLHLEVRNGNI